MDKLKAIGENRMRLGVGILVVITVSIVVAAWRDNPAYLTAVVPTLVVAFNSLVGRDDEAKE